MANMNVTIRLDENVRKEADELFDQLGMTLSTAVNVFIRQCLREQRIPFEVSMHPNIEYHTISLDDGPDSRQ